MSSRLIVLAVGLALTSLPACKSPRAKHEARARAVLDALPAFAPLARAAPRSTEATAAPLAALKNLSVKYQDSNALLIHLEELEVPSQRLRLPVRINQRSPTVDVAAALGVTRAGDAGVLDTGYNPACPEDSPDWQRLGALEYVLVARSFDHEGAKLVGDHKFQGGGWAGDVLVFDFATKQLLGGFPLAATHHAVVGTRLGRDEQNLAADLALAARGNLDAALRQWIPAVGEHDEIN